MRMSVKPSAGPFLFWVSLAQLISWGSTLYLFGVLVQPLEAALQITRGQISLAFSLAMLVEGVLAYPVGRLIDAGHGRIVMTLGSALASISLLAMSQVTRLSELYLVWACLGAALACILYTPIFSIVTRRFPEDFRRAIIIITFLGGLASTVFIPLMAWLMAQWGWSKMVQAMACLHLLACLPIHWVLLKDEPKPRQAKRARLDASEHPAGLASQKKVMLLIGAFTALAMAMASALAAHLIPMLRERGLSEFWVVWIPAAVGVIQVLGRMGILWSDGKFNTHRVNAVIVWLTPFSIVLLILAGSDTFLLLMFALVWGVANGCQTIVKGTAIAQYVSQENVAALNGRLGLPTALARTLVPWLIGLFWTPSAGYGVSIIFLLGLASLAAACFILAQKIANKAQPI
jgi:predicted MFS family arabinose efflux permease